MTLPQYVHSPDQLSALTMELRGYIDAKRDASRRSDHGGALEPPVSKELRGLLDTSEETADQLLKQLAELLKNAPTVHVITAGPAGNDLKRQITAWFRGQIHQDTLLTFAQRRDLGGGVVVRAGSHIYDFSFKRKVLDNKHRISEIAFGAPAGQQQQAQPAAQQQQAAAAPPASPQQQPAPQRGNTGNVR